METHRIMNEIDNVENDKELETTLEVIVQDIAHQVVVLRSAVYDNPYVDTITLEELTRRVAEAVKDEYLTI